jgi:hypothetical protein
MALPILATAHVLYLSWPLTVPSGKRFPRMRDAGDLWRIALLTIVGASVFVRPVWGLSEAQLLEKRSAWSSSKPRAYLYELWSAGAAPGAANWPQRIEVQDGHVIAGTNLAGAERVNHIETPGRAKLASKCW